MPEETNIYKQDKLRVLSKITPPHQSVYSKIKKKKINNENKKKFVFENEIVYFVSLWW